MSESVKTKLQVLQRWGLTIFLTAMGLFAPLWGQAKPELCAQVHSFRLQSSELESWSRFVSMDPKYAGEDRGAYQDPATQMHWKVKYFSEAEKQPFEVFIKDGTLVDRQGQKKESEFDDENSEFRHGLFVIDAKKRMFFLPFEERGRFHHTSLTSGEPVLFAGTLTLANGRVLELTNDSGHYKPDVLQSLMAIRAMHLMGIDLRSLRIVGRLARDLADTYSMSSAEVRMVLGRLFQNQLLTAEELRSFVRKSGK